MNSWLIILGFFASALLGGDIAGKICNTLVERKRLETRDRKTTVELVLVVPDEEDELDDELFLSSLFSELWDDDDQPINANIENNDTNTTDQCR